MLERCVRAIFTIPLLRCPAILIKIADTSMIRGDPIIGRQCDVENLIHVLVNGDIGVDKDAGVIGGQLKSSELSPGILESGRYEGSFPVVWQQERFNWMYY